MELTSNVLPLKLQQFVRLAGGDPSGAFTNNLFYFDLVNTFRTRRTQEQEEKLIAYTLLNPEIITMKLKNHMIFEFFYDRTTKITHPPKMYDFWQTALVTIINALQELDDSDDVIGDHTYVYRLQSGIMNHTSLFKYMIVDGNFSVGEPDFLVYSVIVRGELDKLRILSDVFDLDNIDMFPGIYDVAVKHGRSEIIKYLRFHVGLDLTKYGKVMEFENYPSTHKFMFYQTGLYIIESRDTPIIGTKQNYIDTIKHVMEVYPHPVTVKTLDCWAEATRLKTYGWDTLCFKEIVDALRPFIKESIPLSHDFKEFNTDVFGKEWSDRACIIEYCKGLETRYALLEEKFNALYTQFTGSRDCPVDEF